MRSVSARTPVMSWYLENGWVLAAKNTVTPVNAMKIKFNTRKKGKKLKNNSKSKIPSVRYADRNNNANPSEMTNIV